MLKRMLCGPAPALAFVIASRNDPAPVSALVVTVKSVAASGAAATPQASETRAPAIRESRIGDSCVVRKCSGEGESMTKVSGDTPPPRPGAGLAPAPSGRQFSGVSASLTNQAGTAMDRDCA